MTGKDQTKGFLRLLTASSASEPEQCYSLDTNAEVVLGRDLDCNIVLDSNLYGMVSRHHASVIQVTNTDDKAPSWLVCDLNSVNGTFVNGQKLRGCKLCREGDRILLGQNGPEFILEYQNFSSKKQRKKPQPPVTRPQLRHSQPDIVTITQLFPIFSTGRDLTRKAYLIPGIATVGFVVLMFAAVGQPVFNLVVAAYLAGAACYFVYQLCGKHKPWWMLLGSAFSTILILHSPLLPVFIIVFREILPGSLPTPESVSFPILLIRMFFGAGLMEELLKALPVLVAYLLGYRLRSPWRERIGVAEPLDGILLGTASAVGFTLSETLGQYVPETIQSVTFQAGDSIGQLVGLQLLIPRILGSVAGHMAYTGYFGYFIGLSVLKPNQRWQILSVGYLSAAGLHALWNATGIFNAFVLAVVGVLSYAFLTAAILKARTLSPTRAQNFATSFFTRQK